MGAQADNNTIIITTAMVFIIPPLVANWLWQFRVADSLIHLPPFSALVMRYCDKQHGKIDKAQASFPLSCLLYLR